MSTARRTTFKFAVDEQSGRVSAILLRPTTASSGIVLAHGAGAGMRHAFMESIAGRLAGEGIATLRYQFPYMEKGAGGPNPARVLQATVRAAVRTAATKLKGLPLFAGGKSMGGRMTSLAAAVEDLPGVRGLIFFGFPLHAPGKPSAERGEHLLDVKTPTLFLQGSRDKLADLARLRPLHKRLGRRATLKVLEEADHSFRVPKRSGRTVDDVLEEMVGDVSKWVSKQI